MKNVLIILAVLVFLLGLIGSFSTLGNTSGGGAKSDETTVKDPYLQPDGGLQVDEYLTVYNYFYSAGDSSVERQLASYINGSCNDYITGNDSRICMGRVSNSTGAALIAFAFDDLEIGKTYLIRFYDSGDLIDRTLRYRFSNNTNFQSFDIEKSTDGYHTFVFEAKSTQLQLGVLYFPDPPSNDILTVYGNQLNENIQLDLIEVRE